MVKNPYTFQLDVCMDFIAIGFLLVKAESDHHAVITLGQFANRIEGRIVERIGHKSHDA